MKSIQSTCTLLTLYLNHRLLSRTRMWRMSLTLVSTCKQSEFQWVRFSWRPLKPTGGIRSGRDGTGQGEKSRKSELTTMLTWVSEDGLQEVQCLWLFWPCFFFLFAQVMMQGSVKRPSSFDQLRLSKDDGKAYTFKIRGWWACFGGSRNLFASKVAWGVKRKLSYFSNGNIDKEW